MLSGPRDLIRVQKLRLASDAIMVGVGTVISDNPSLRVHWRMLGSRRKTSKSPIRIILDSKGRTPNGSHVLDGSVPTIIITSSACKKKFPSDVRHIAMGRGKVDLQRTLDLLGSELGLRQLMVEGGSSVITNMLRAGLVDRMTVFMAPVVIGGHGAPPIVGGPETPNKHGLIHLRLNSVRKLDGGALLDFVRA